MCESPVCNTFTIAHCSANVQSFVAKDSYGCFCVQSLPRPGGAGTAGSPFAPWPAAVTSAASTNWLCDIMTQSGVGYMTRLEFLELCRNRSILTTLVDKYCIMPDHIHLILRIESDIDGRMISAPTIFYAKCTIESVGAVTNRP